MNLYETAYSNEVHQLLITASRHLFVLKNGAVRYQKTIIEGGWKKPTDFSKNQIIHFILRDHYSHAMYAEIHTRSELVTAEEFLWKAWSQKESHPFCGIPVGLILPKSVYSDTLCTFLSTLGIKIAKPTGGFMAGVRTFREWDPMLEFVYNFRHEPLNSFKELQAKVPEILQTHFDFNSDGTSKLEVWRSHLRDLRLPPPQEEFFKIYQQAMHNKTYMEAKR